MLKVSPCVLRVFRALRGNCLFLVTLSLHALHVLHGKHLSYQRSSVLICGRIRG